MPWLIGIDEAGYGPNLGPFVMSMAAIHVPAKLADRDLWRLLSSVTRKSSDPDDGRLCVDDSKKVYAHSEGIGRLERNILPFQQNGHETPIGLDDYWRRCCITPLQALVAEPWLMTFESIPVENPLADLLDAGRRLLQRFAKLQIEMLPVRSVVVSPKQFNALTVGDDSKAAVSSWSFQQLMSCLPDSRDGEPKRVWVDKHGGRNHYHEVVQGACPDGLVLARTESSRRSDYRVCGPNGCEISFQPEADSRFFPVALASMASKYLRELLMRQFNRFWQQHMPELKPTAGYPSDSRRFYEDIRPIRERLGIADELLWRVR